MSTENAPRDVIEALLHRSEVLEDLIETPKSRRELVSELHIPQSTIYRALDELEALSLLTSSSDRIELTPHGQLAIKERRHLERRIDELYHEAARTDEVLEALVQRAEIIELMRPDSCEKQTLIDDLDVSRSTIERALLELEELNLIEYASGSPRFAETNRQTIREYAVFKERVEGLVAASELLELLETDVDIDPAALVGAEIIFPGEVAPFSTGDRLLELLRGTTRLRNLSKGHVIPESTDVVHRKLLQDGMACKTVFQADVLDYLEAEYPQEMEEIATLENCTYTTIDSLPFALWLLKRPDDTHICIQIFDNERQFGGLIINNTEEAIEWGQKTWNQYLQRSNRAEL